MVNNIKTIVDLVVKRIDLVTKFISSLFIMTLFTNYLYDYYYVNILDLLPLLPVNDTLRMYKNDDIRMYNFNCITDTIVEVITTCNTYTLLTVHLL